MMLHNFLVKTYAEQQSLNSLRLQQTTVQAISLIEGNKNIVRSSNVNHLQ